jgi:hypothetical protein
LSNNILLYIVHQDIQTVRLFLCLLCGILDGFEGHKIQRDVCDGRIRNGCFDVGDGSLGLRRCSRGEEDFGRVVFGEFEDGLLSKSSIP